MFLFQGLILAVLLSGVIGAFNNSCNTKEIGDKHNFKKGDQQLLVMEFAKNGPENSKFISMCLNVDTYTYMGPKMTISDKFFKKDGTNEFDESVRVRIHLYSGINIEGSSVACEEEETKDEGGEVKSNEETSAETSEEDQKCSDLKLNPPTKNHTEYKQMFKGNRVVPYRTVIITMEKGEPSGIKWDDRVECDTCDTDTCAEGACTIDVDLAEEEDKHTTFAVFVAWEGTDAEGDKLLSINSIDYNFRFVSGKSLYDSAVGIFNTVKNWFDDVFW